MDMVATMNISAAVSVLQHGISVFDEHTIAVVGIIFEDNFAHIWSDRLTKLSVHPLGACLSFLNQSLIIFDFARVFLEDKLSGSIIGRIVDGEEDLELLVKVIKDDLLHLLSDRLALHGVASTYFIEAPWVFVGLFRQDLCINDSVNTNLVEEIFSFGILIPRLVNSILVAEEIPVGDEGLLCYPVVAISALQFKDCLAPFTQFRELSENAHDLSIIELLLYSEFDMIRGFWLFIEIILFILNAQLPENLILITIQYLLLFIRHTCRIFLKDGFITLKHSSKFAYLNKIMTQDVNSYLFNQFAQNKYNGAK